LGDWVDVERILGTSLPCDFKDFTEVYGSVEICHWLWFHTPFAFDPQELRDLLLTSLARLGQFDSEVSRRADIAYPDYPSPGGLLPIGTTEDGDVIAWITEGAPEEWGTFFWFRPGIKTFPFGNLSVTGFLLDLLSLKSPLFSAGLDPGPFSAENRRVDVGG
jgi:hypothetical protein